jgi:signal transduction histidine kinase/ActR/RegA family two-component response regulator
MDVSTHQQSNTLRFRREVVDRFGVLPNFFCSADAAPGLVEELWKFAKSAYLDSPLPSLFKERLFVHLSRFCEVRYCIVRHVGFLIGQGRPAGDADAGPETVEQVIEMLRRPLAEGPAVTKVLERLERVSLRGQLPEPRTECETDLFDALTIMFLSPRDCAGARAAVRAAVGDATFELLVAYLAFIRTAHYWTEMHPELTYEPDMAEILRGYGELADLLLDTSEAELVQGGVRLRETLHQLRRVEGALQESESRHAFLLRVGDALRLLADPLAIQEAASRFLGERLLTDRACYAEIDGAQGCVIVQRPFLRGGVPTVVGRYSLDAFDWAAAPIFQTGGPVVVDDIRTSPLIADTDRPALAAINVGAFVAAPLIKDGRVVAALCVSDLSSRAWTPEEVELVKETAQRTWEVIERARAEEQLREASARKDEFLAMLAHELRNPLAPIRTGLELIRRGGDTVGGVERVRGMMERQVGHMVRLIDDLLDVSRITSGRIALQREPTPLESLVHSAVETNRAALAAKHIELNVELPKEPCVIDVDPTRFVQILSNLLNNAVKFTNNGGSVRISATVAQPESETPSVTIAVVDSGIGMPPELLPRVFDLFTQGETRSSQPGLGIGLALARRLVELHAGRLDARSEGVGRGSEFSIQLPLATTQSIPVAAARAVVEQRLERQILIIDDNHDAADATAMLVEEMGGDARVAYDGVTALEMLEGYQPEVILLDIGMRGLDGYETCQRIRGVLGNRVLLVALTGFGQDHDKEKAKRAGFDAHLTKPADGAALARLLDKMSPTRS